MPKVDVRAVSMYPADWSIVEAADQGDDNLSATLRHIVREWAEWQHEIKAAQYRRLTDKRAEYVVGEPAQ